MAKSVATKRRKSQSKVVSSDVAQQDVSTGLVGTPEGQTEQKEAATTVQDTDVKQVQANKEEQDPQVDLVIEVKGSRTNVTVSWDGKKEEGEADDLEMGTNAHDQKMAIVKGKRKAVSKEKSLTKKAKLVDDGFCVFVGNLNNSKAYDEVKDALASYFMTQSLLVQDIRLDQSKKHAYIGMASQLDLTKALTLNGEQFLDKKLRVEKAKGKTEVKTKKKKVKALSENKKAEKNTRCLFLKNVPFNATKDEIQKVFPEAVDVRFPGRTKGPNKGMAFVEFKDKALATSLLQRKQEVKIRDRVLIVDSAGESKHIKVNNENKKAKQKPAAAAAPNKMLFLSNLAFTTSGKNLNKMFPTAVNITLPQVKGKSRGFAFVEFATEENAEQALQSSKNAKMGKRNINVELYNMQENAYKMKVLSKTLIVMGLAEQTTTETLRKAFDGAVAARIVAKESGVSKRFGFVDFDTEENCKAAKDAIEDCEIDGNKVCVAYARRKGVKPAPGAKKSPLTPSAGKAAGQKPKRDGKGGMKGRRPKRPQEAVKKEVK
ncbi:nucleolin-like isoform X2 [Nelusetta ayraudi]|uniref:nucleolin-like isoform X2 n=1 Tax=Nelusetta ayraudi TaxID=303726 RepID=UPI003F6F466F